MRVKDSQWFQEGSERVSVGILRRISEISGGYKMFCEDLEVIYGGFLEFSAGFQGVPRGLPREFQRSSSGILGDI